jgi:hypothetical protein
MVGLMVERLTDDDYGLFFFGVLSLCWGVFPFLAVPFLQVLFQNISFPCDFRVHGEGSFTPLGTWLARQYQR